jgi:hypothetical protein
MFVNDEADGTARATLAMLGHYSVSEAETGEEEALALLRREC